MSDSEDEAVERQFKIVLVGDPAVGKTALANKYAQESFSKKYTPTVGVEFYLKRIMLPGSKPAALKIWDVGGAAMEGTMIDKYIFGAHAVLLVYDVSNFNSFENLDGWLKQCKRCIGSSEDRPLPCSFALIANKIDLEHKRSVKSERHHRFAQENALLTYAVSSKSGEGVNLCFQKIVAELMGIKLSRADQEQQHQVVKAEVMIPRQDRIIANSSGTVKTAVCAVVGLSVADSFAKGYGKRLLVMVRLRRAKVWTLFACP